MPPNGRLRRWLAGVPCGVVVGVPLAVYVGTTAAHGHWYDAGEFIAAGQSLGISHPPGHPLHGLLSQMAIWLPLGPIAWRVALLSAFTAAAALGCLHAAITTTLCRTTTLPAERCRALALAAVWWVGASSGWWLQAVRPEVYALQASLTCAVVALATHVSRLPRPSPRQMGSLALLAGLGLTNHHFIMLTVLPALLVLLWRRESLKHWRLALGYFALSLMVYLYLPLRAARQPWLNLGAPRSWANFLWVVSARVFQKNSGAGVPQSYQQRLLDVLAALAQSVDAAVLLLAMGGFYLLWRQPASRSLAALWSLLWWVGVVARVWLGFVAQNPDALGYLMVPLAASVMAATVLLAGCIDAVAARWPRYAWQQLVVVTMLLAAGLRASAVAVERSLHRFVAIDRLQERDRRMLPPRSVVLQFNPQSIAATWGAESAERLRPDIVWLPMPFLPYAGVANDAVLAGIARRSEATAWHAVADQRPVWMELDSRLPSGWYERLQPAPPTPYARFEGVHWVSATAAWPDFESVDTATRDQLLWRAYHHALLHQRRGEFLLALPHAEQALRWYPDVEELRSLSAALRRRQAEM